MKLHSTRQHADKTFPGTYIAHEYLDALNRIACKKLHEMIDATTDENLDQVLASIERMNDILDDALEQVIIEV